MHRVLGLAIAVGLLGGCGGTEKPVKPPVDQKQQKKDELRLALREARDAARDNNIEAADGAYAKAYKLSDDYDVVFERVEFLLKVGKLQRAQDAAKQFYDTHDTNTKGYRLYAETLLQNDKPKLALDVADQILGFDAQDPIGHERRGRALVAMDRLAEGLEELRKAVQVDDTSVALLVSLGLGLNKANKNDEAALRFRDALKRAPDDASIHTYLGMALRNQGELEEAKKMLDRAIELDPESGRAYFELGLVLNAQQKQGESEMALMKAVQKSPNESQYWYALGEIFRLQERATEAINAYKKSLEIEPPYPKASAKLAALYIDAKKYDEAEQTLVPAAERDPENPIHHYYLGVVRAAKGEKKEAIDSYQKFLELAPKDDPDIRRAKSAIYTLKRR